MPTDRNSPAPVTPPKLHFLRLEDRLNPVAVPTAEQLLTFTPNSVLDLATTSPDAPVASDSVTTTAVSDPAVVAPVDPIPVPNSYQLVLPTIGDVPPATDSSGGTIAMFSVVPPPPAASLSGFVYVDEGANGGVRDDGVKQAGEPGIPGATVTLLRVINGVTITASQTTTDASGFYQFPSLSPFGEYRLVESQPAGFLDGKDTLGTIGGLTRGILGGNDHFGGISLNASDVGVNYNFGELLPAPTPGALSGFVYVDEGAGGGVRDDGVKQAGEPGIPGTTVTLFRVVNGQTVSAAQTTTDANGFYRFDNLTPDSGYIVREGQPGQYVDGKDTPGSTGGTNSANDELSAITVPAGGESQNNNFGELLGSISGFVYVDEGAGGGTRDDGVKQGGEPGIAGVVVRLLRNGVAQATATTDANGAYRFDRLLLGGGYTVEEVAQPAGFNDGKDTAGTPGGGTADNEIISNITLSQGAPNSPDNNFGELIPPALGSLSGFVYVDEGANGGTRDDGVKQAGEPGIPGTTVVLFRVVSGTTTSVSQTTTDANGFYRFTNLQPGGGYIVRETQPGGFNDGKDTPGSTGGTNSANDELSAVTVPAGGESVNNNYGELVPLAQFSGFVYEDTDNDGVKDAGEAAIPGTIVTLTNGTTTLTATTDGNGFYQFTSLTPGTYTATETQPAAYLDGKDTAGTRGGTVTNDRIASVLLNPGDDSQNNNFGELRPARLSGFEYVDEGAGGGTRDDGVKQPGEPGIGGVVMTLAGTDDLGTVSRLATTAADGSYSFENLRPGTYTVSAAQPGGFVDGKDTPGSTGGTAPQTDTLTGIPLGVGGNSVNNNFGELLQPGSLSGFVYEDTDNDGVKDPGEAGIPGAVVTLFQVVNGQTVSVGQTTSDANGAYQFTGLTPGDGYIVRETQPANYQDGKDTPGSTGGTNSANDQLSAIIVPANGASVNNNFGERLGQLSGFVYVDANNDGVKDPGEAPIPGTTVTLFRVVNGQTISPTQSTTDANGAYQFTRLAPGTYVVAETQPAAFTDGKDTPDAGNGATNPSNDVIATIGIGGANDLDSPNNNFGELVPPQPARLGGFVYQDTNDNGLREFGELAIPGATVTLFRVENGQTTSVSQTTTDANGEYRFTDLPAGTYAVREAQPAGFNDGKDTPGDTGGTNPSNDLLTAIPLVPGANSQNNNFGELLPPPPPPQPGSLSGFVYEDPNDNGVKDAGEAGIPGVVLQLIAANTTGQPGLPGPQFATTDANGFYQFNNLTPSPALIYTVNEAQPTAFLDGRDTPGSTGGNNSVNDVLSVVTVPAGGASVNNNFGELTPVSLYGYVWHDVNRSGTLDPSEQGLGGATVTLTGTTLSGRPVTTAATTTDAFGRYAFTALPPGVYSVVQSNTPSGYSDFKEENAARLTVTGSSPLSFSTFALTRDAGPLNFGKVQGSIVVPPPPPNPQFPDPSKQNFLGSSGGSVTVPPTTPGAIEPGPFNPAVIGTGTTPRVYAIGSGAGVASVVRVMDANTGGELYHLQPFESAFLGGVTTAVGDLNGDGVGDVIAAAAAGGGPRVKAFDGQTGAVLHDFFAYAPNFTGGVWVASGDVDGDGYADIVTGAGAGGGPHVKAFSGRTGQLLQSFFAFDAGNTGGARVAVGDFNGDGRADIAAGTGAGVASQIITFDARSLAVLNRLQPFESAFLGGVNLAAGDVNGDGRAELIAGAASGGGPRVRVMDASTGASVYDFFAYDPSFAGGVTVAARDLTGDGRAEIVTGSGAGQQARIQVFSGATLAPLDSYYGFESTFKNGVYVG